MRLLLALAVALYFALPAAPHAQSIDPSNMVSGMDSVLWSPGATCMDLYTVPPGQIFILTDIHSTAAPQWILDDGVVRYVRPLHDGAFATGLVFHSGHRLGLCTTGGGGYLMYSWSGYLISTVVGVEPSINPEDRLGFSLGPIPRAATWLNSASNWRSRRT
jgi:hypothetical protein